MRHPLLAIALAITIAAGIGVRATAATGRPDILLIIADDQCYRDFGFMGNEAVHTPHLDRLAASSARFPNGYVPTSVCRPSLASLLTGLYPHQHHIHFNHPPPGNGGFNRLSDPDDYNRIRARGARRIEELPTVPRLLAQAGYRTLQTGKHWEGHFRQAGFTDGMTVNRAVPGQDFGGNRTLAGGQLVAHGNGDAGLRIGRVTMQPIEDFLATVGTSPWFVWYAPYLPHEPHDSPPEFYDLARARPGVQPHQLPYYASIAQFDHSVGRLLEIIERHNNLDNTLILFVSDNGWTPRREKDAAGHYRHTRQSKRSPFEDGLRTPILLAWPKASTAPVPPRAFPHLVSSVDIAPTILSAAGVMPPDHLPGRDLLPAARGTEDLEDRPVFGEIYPGDASVLGNPSADLAYRWVRDGHLKLIVPHRHGDAHPWGRYLDAPALFDLATDPREKHNLLEDPAHAADADRLRTLLDSWWSPS